MIPGAVRFARYAYPPNQLGFCGPDDHSALFEYGTQRVEDGGLRALAREFEGAWPYLDLIARSNGRDPLDHDVVGAYWIGNGLLNHVDMSALGASMEERFRRRAGTSWEAVSDAVTSGAMPHHGFHVFCVYPWVGLMRTGMSDQPLQVLDRCRIRMGEVIDVIGDTARVASRLLVLDDDRLRLGDTGVETVTWATDGHGFAERLKPGDRVAMHWSWVCERLTEGEVRILQRQTEFVIGLANRVLARPRTGVLA